MFAKLAVLIVLLLSLGVWGCGHYAPVVGTKQDILRLPASELSIRARGLADNDIPSISRLRELQFLDFSSGYGAREARITDEGLQRLAKLELANLDNLNLGWCKNITDAGLKQVSQMETENGWAYRHVRR